MNDGVYQSSIPESMDIDDDIFSKISNGLQQDFAMNAMEANSSEAAANQVNPENYGGSSHNLDIQNLFSDPTFSALSLMTPHAHAVPVVSPGDGLLQSERIDNSLAEIEPMRVNSEDVRGTLMADPNALGESLGSIELNATRNASMQSNDHSQGPAASRMATQRRALPDANSSHTQTTSGSGTSAEGTAAEKAEVYFSDYELPEFHHFKVSVKFKSTPMLEKDVTKKGGCLLHYQPSDPPPIPVPADQLPIAEVDRISIPVKIKNEQDGSLQEFPWDNDNQKRFTELILRNFHLGVEFYSREGNIYARRRSGTKLYWQSTEEQPGRAEKLNTNEETEVFNWEKFQQTCKASMVSGNLTKLSLPAIWFSLCEKWDRESSRITTKLVWARVVPTRACEMVKIVKKQDVRSIESLESLHSSLFGISY